MSDRGKTISDYLLPEFISEYGEGDYGFEDTEVMIKNGLC